MSYKTIINKIKGVLPYPNLDDLIRKEIPKIKKYATKKHENIMMAIHDGIITEEIGYAQMNDIYSEIDDKICAMLDNTDNMLDFLADIEDHYKNEKTDVIDISKYILKETLKYQRLSAEILGLSIYVDTLFEEYGLLEDDDDDFDYDCEDDDEDEGEPEEEPEDSEDDEDAEDDEEPTVYKSELTFRDKLFAATAVEVVESVFEDGIDMNINYKTKDYTGVFALRCIKTGTFAYGHISMAPGMIGPVGAWSKLEMQGFIGIMKTKCPDNAFYKWYTSEDGYQKYVKEWTKLTEKTADK